MFVLRDGWDFGAGAILLLAARNDTQRRQVFAAIGPLWSWNEVWLVAGGGVLALAFPHIMGVALSGFYLAVFLVLWTLLLRGLAIEVRGHIDEPLWRAFWDFMFAASNLLIVALLGVALGNLLRGVPLDRRGEFFLPLFTNFNVSGSTGLIDWYTLSIGVFSTLTLTAHGAAYVAFKTDGGAHANSVRLAGRLWTATFVCFPIVSWLTWFVHRDFFSILLTRPAGWLAILTLLVGASLIAGSRASGRDRIGFIGSCCVVVALTAGAAVSLFPILLRSTIAESYSLSVYTDAYGDVGLRVGAFWWPAAFGLTLVYMFFIARNYRGKAKPTQDTQGFYRLTPVLTQGWREAHAPSLVRKAP
jgi:cytochrome bd ubiquinol oxidase subunit II